ncbi:MAG: hypothetical protein KAI74_04315, partial [Kiritimatiellae bacterium]|nr:hypothetical protein [Kiritimatiellia bacterium]
MKRAFILMIAGVCFGVVSVSADTWYVATNSASDGPGTAWTNAFHTIQGGVDAASLAFFDTVLVADGIYDTGGAVTPDGTLFNRVMVNK